MAFDLWLAFVAATAIIMVIPGPTILLVLSYALAQGRSVALASVAGVALGDLIAMTTSLLGLGALMAASATAFTVVKWAGAVYLLWLGITMLRSAGHAKASLVAVKPQPPRAIFLHMAMVTTLNPKTIGFFIAFVPQFVDPTHAVVPQFAILITTFVGFGILNALGYVLLADLLRSRITRPAVLRWLTRLGGATLITMSALTASLQRAN